MTLTRTIRRAVRRAFAITKDATTKVQWTFTPTQIGSYDPLLDKMVFVSSTTVELEVIVYNRKENDDKTAYSATGLYVDAPSKLENALVVVPFMEIGTNVPGTNDKMTWSGFQFSVESVEHVPTEAVYLVAIRRSG